MCGPLLWGFWWIFPVIGLAMCLVMILFASTGRGCMCMGRHHAMDRSPIREPVK